MSMVFALVLLGCADDGTACERLPTQAEQYGSKALCEAGQEMALQSEAAMQADYPTVVSRCLPMNVAPAIAAGGRKATVPLR
ncbi:hypothetical protein KRR38_26790 [Novosphingobium sp. G106]|uniref:hypothetical protein n=1 Tax=Novosphingobium sp. G106 TaxID=2849500 RepID=UPI001C2D0D1D|nr:hypothetical protein [Novosphingobium sp. G106]MBV1691191.1 hypothetical protein [Novosphingobium sp. G106]